jgi:RNA polymerase primary sigma factor
MEALNKISRVSRAMTTELGHEPTPQELAPRLRISVDKVQFLRDAAQQPLSLDMLVGDDAALADVLRDPATASPTDELLGRDVAEQVDRALARLSARERAVLRLRFGIGNGQEGLTLEQIGERFALTRERIRQIEAKALRKLRHGEDLRAFVRS